MTQRICVALGALLLLAVSVWAQSDDNQTSPQSAAIDERLLPIGDEEASEGAAAVTQEGGGEDEGAGRTSAIGFGDVLRMLLVLGGVVGVIYLTFGLLKRASRSQVRSSTLIHNLSTVPLGGNRALHLIRVGERHYLIGSAEQHVQLIEAIDDQETIDYIQQNKDGSDTTPNEVGGSFRDRIRALLANIQRPGAARATGGRATGGRGTADSAATDARTTARRATGATVAPDIMSRISNNHKRLRGV